MAAEAASFNTVIDSMSCEERLRISPPAIPSITINGSFEAVIEVAPRICKDEPEFGLAEAVLFTFNPATLPVNISIGLFIAPCWNSLLSTCTMELESSFLLNEPYPTTTTSSKVCESSAKTTLISCCPLQATS